MAKKIKKLFALIMVMCMLVSMLPLQALAEETDLSTLEGLDVSMTIDEETNTVVVEFAPAAEETVSEEETAPAAEETVSEEETAPAAEETASEEEAAPAEETASEEETAPAAEETASEEEAAPAAEETASEEEVAPDAEETVSEDAVIIETPTGDLEWESELTFGENIDAEVTDVTVTEEVTEEGAIIVTESATVETEGTLENGAEVEGEEIYTETTTTVTTETEETITVEAALEGQETTTLEDAAITPDDTDLPEVEIPVITEDAEIVVPENAEVEVEVKENEETGETVTTETVTTTEEEKVEGENVTSETTTVTTVEKTTTETTTEEGETETTESVKVTVNVTETTNEVVGDVQEGEDDTEYDYTEIETTIEREVTTEAGDVEVTVNEGDVTNLEALAPEEFEGKDYDNKEGLLTGWSPDSLQSYADAVAKPEDAPGYDYQWTGYAEATNAVRAVSVDVVYKKDPVTGEALKDENGDYIIESMSYSGKYKDGMDATPSIFALKKYNEDGTESLYYAYCIDNDTGAQPGSWYKVTNLEDSDYYPDEESADKLRAIVNNGYWGQESGKGSSAQMMEKLLAYYGEDATIEVDDKNGNMISFNVREVLAGMNDADALAVTQTAIWSYANGTLAVQDGKDGSIIETIYSVVKPKANLANTDRDYDYERDARLKAMYMWLLGLEGESAASEDVTTIINENNFVEDMSITIKDKVEDHTDNYDENDDNDVYNTELNFTLAFVPDTTSDDLLVYLMDENGEKIKDANGDYIVRRLAGTNSEGREAETILPDTNGVYTLSGLQLSENSDFKFDLRLDGTQYLKQGVYVYTAHGGSSASQTMVGIAEGTHTVNVAASMTISFNVDESKNVVATRYWREESDPVVFVTPAEVVPPAEEEETPAPPVRYRMERGVGEEEVIIDEPVPLADVPQTGDNSVLWFALIMLSGLGLCILDLSGKKCKA